MASFPYDKSSILNDMVLGWAFAPIRYYHSVDPNSSNLFKIPENLKIKKALKTIAIN